MEKDKNTENLENHQIIQQLENRWRDIRFTYSKRYPVLTEEDITYKNGEFDAMTERIANRTKRTKKQVQNEIQNWEDDIHFNPIME
ncbi:hypothetical protein [uncultured Cyclobacterium sp.]|uniref:hypothetical protein n=1 Tax=uncultured Cyclobacterium sp. TaxID=453820 RepID=UPI0030EE8F49|tara:strand:- start:214274 stop:214531 length:258 start_codon:yes stop_codon:yes gene_type:complete